MAEDLTRHYAVRQGIGPKATLRALDGATFSLQPGRTLAVVGESGCGKSTLARVATLIEPPSGGRLVIDGLDVGTAGRRQRKALRREVQMIFQDPSASLNPRQKVGTIIQEPLAINTRQPARLRR